MTFADLDKKIAPPAAVAKPPPPTVVETVEREARLVNPLLFGTGLVVFAIGMSGNLSSGPVSEYANQLIGSTLVCEMYMLWIAMGLWLAIDKPAWLRIPIVIGTVFVYIFVITHDNQFSLAPQALWLLCVRLLPPGFIRVFENENLKRVRAVALASIACLAVQIVIFALSASALASIGIGTTQGDVITAPRWFSGVIWGAYYIELAFLLPYVERNRVEFDTA